MSVRSRILFGATSLVAVFGVGIAALAFPPMPQQSAAQPQQPPATVTSPTELPAVIPVVVEKSSLTGSKTELKPVAPTPKARLCVIQPQRLDTASWTDRLYFDPLTLVISAEKGSPECADAMAAASEIAGDYIGRVTILFECYDSGNPSMFGEVAAARGPSPSKKFSVILNQHRMTTHLTVIDKQWNDPKASWGDQPYLQRIAQDDGQLVLQTDHLGTSQLSGLSEPSQLRWLKGKIDAESLRLWLAVVSEREMKAAIKPGPPCFRELKEECWRSLFATRLPQPVIFVPKKLLQDEAWEEAARLAAQFPDARPWVVVADTQFGVALHKILSEDKGKKLEGVAPPEGKVSVIAYQLTNRTGNPKGEAVHSGPYVLEANEPIAKELDRVLRDKVKLTPQPSTQTLLVTQQTSMAESVPSKK